MIQAGLPHLGCVLRRMFSSELRPQSATCDGIDEAIGSDDAAIVGPRRLRRDIATVEVSLHRLEWALQRVAETGAAGETQFGDLVRRGQRH